jgi:hypothetical protein
MRVDFKKNIFSDHRGPVKLTAFEVPFDLYRLNRVVKLTEARKLVGETHPEYNLVVRKPLGFSIHT